LFLFFSSFFFLRFFFEEKKTKKKKRDKKIIYLPVKTFLNKNKISKKQNEKQSFSKFFNYPLKNAIKNTKSFLNY